MSSQTAGERLIPPAPPSMQAKLCSPPPHVLPPPTNRRAALPCPARAFNPLLSGSPSPTAQPGKIVSENPPPFSALSPPRQQVSPSRPPRQANRFSISGEVSGELNKLQLINRQSFPPARTVVVPPLSPLNLLPVCPHRPRSTPLKSQALLPVPAPRHPAPAATSQRAIDRDRDGAGERLAREQQQQRDGEDSEPQEAV